MKPNLLSEEKVIITAAITGGAHGKCQIPTYQLHLKNKPMMR
jgi:hypothetical protein